MPKYQGIPKHLIVKFLEAVKKHECLWRMNTDDWKDSFKKEIAYLDIIREVGMPNLTIQDVKYNLVTRRSAYRNYRKQVLECAKRKMPKPKVPMWYDLADSFLRNSCMSVPLKQTVSSQDIVEPFVIKKPTATYGTPRPSSTPRPPADAPTETIRSEPEDEFDLFGKSVAVQLDKMPFETAITLQLKLQALVTKHRLTNAKKVSDAREPVTQSRPIDHVFDSIDAPSTSTTTTTINRTFPNVNVQESTFDEFLDSMEMFIKEENDL
ncbi:uncharacterized protein LOC105386188 [Plutella xylostella]|uniref:uncharacterized protein LOC105386188 n=1 Tax=Plutella xylostella TaxID=51655 RepID=UPI00203303D7|nr:uncharacterized protein LOC105386188 [Plutella xylostella]